MGLHDCMPNANERRTSDSVSELNWCRGEILCMILWKQRCESKNMFLVEGFLIRQLLNTILPYRDDCLTMSSNELSFHNTRRISQTTHSSIVTNTQLPHYHWMKHQPYLWWGLCRVVYIMADRGLAMVVLVRATPSSVAFLQPATNDLTLLLKVQYHFLEILVFSYFNRKRSAPRP